MKLRRAILAVCLAIGSCVIANAGQVKWNVIDDQPNWVSDTSDNHEWNTVEAADSTYVYVIHGSAGYDTTHNLVRCKRYNQLGSNTATVSFNPPNGHEWRFISASVATNGDVYAAAIDLHTTPIVHLVVFHMTAGSYTTVDPTQTADVNAVPVTYAFANSDGSTSAYFAWNDPQDANGLLTGQIVRMDASGNVAYGTTPTGFSVGSVCADDASVPKGYVFGAIGSYHVGPPPYTTSDGFESQKYTLSSGSLVLTQGSPVKVGLEGGSGSSFCSCFDSATQSFFVAYSEPFRQTTNPTNDPLIRNMVFRKVSTSLSVTAYKAINWWDGIHEGSANQQPAGIGAIRVSSIAHIFWGGPWINNATDVNSNAWPDPTTMFKEPLTTTSSSAGSSFTSFNDKDIKGLVASSQLGAVCTASDSTLRAISAYNGASVQTSDGTHYYPPSGTTANVFTQMVHGNGYVYTLSKALDGSSNIHSYITCYH